ncbi:hypothetical protein GPJ56_005982 [Histomonas meleagridis]|uniref:uncharacterized protein n=1 Tax=Histomonas meleagridis TaxID=135588 RepID=UPI00355A7278|nr:hypothetical protein GPJ56_005982 [Histomonas meleagridis]KAH0799389.1 hypothetical protein GO595_007790 [Histomonas meleagridis]
MNRIINNSLTESKNTIDSLPIIINSLSPSSPLKKIRHALKNLCYYPISSQAIGPLVELFRRELKDHTKIFNLLCFHLINHASIGSPAIANLVALLPKEFEQQKKPSKHIPELYRVFFYLCFYSPQCHQLLIETVSKILSMANTVYSSIQKKGKKSKKSSPYIPLFHQVINTLLDLPSFETTSVKLFSCEEVLTGFVSIYRNSTITDQIACLNFLSHIPTLPTTLLDLFNDNEQSFKSSFMVDFAVNNKEHFESVIDEILKTEPSNQLRLLQLRLSKQGCTSLHLQESLLRTFQPTASYLLPLLSFLENSNSRIEPTKDFLESLYIVCGLPNEQISLLGFMCICFFSEELDWIEQTFVEIINRQILPQKISMISFCIKSWTNSLSYYEQNLPFIKRLFSIVMEKFGECISRKVFTEFVNKFVEINKADELLKIFHNTLLKLNDSETVIYTFYGASLIWNFCENIKFEEFLKDANGYIENADQAIKLVFDITLKNTQMMLPIN